MPNLKSGMDDMALKAIIDSVDGLPDGVKEHYSEQDDGKFVLSVDAVGGYALEDVSGLKASLGKERTERQKLEKTVVKFKDLDPEKAREALARLEEFENIDPEKDADKIANKKFEAAKTQLLEKHGGELGERDKRIGSLETLVDKLARRQEAIAAIAEAKGSVDLLLPHVLNSTKSEITDDGVKVRVLQEDGSDRVNGKGDPMSIGEFVADMKASDTFGRAFEASGHSGSGMHAGGGGSGGGSGTKKGDMGGDKKSRVEAIKNRFPDLAKA